MIQAFRSICGFYFLLMTVSFVRAGDKPRFVEISCEVLEDKIRGGLLAQILGNLNGLPHEMKYIDEPGNVETYTPSLPEGAWTDDDTDIEWVYLVEMQRSGKRLLSYDRIRELWQRHINRRIWCANHYARQLMEIGIAPPLTGRVALNPWSDFNISGQFICESFGLISPGMPRTAADTALHYTHVTIEGEPAQATQLFATMIATAFLVDDAAPTAKSLDRIVDAGLAAVDPKSEIHQIVTQVRQWCRENPSDWKKTRALVKAAYSHHNGEMRDRNGYELNTASTIAALLYGGGDFVETLRLAFNFGWDADNNAATSATIVGVMRGRRWMDRQGWDIRDVYKNISRDEMPNDETITRFGDRLVEVAGRVIIERGGELHAPKGRRVYRIRVEEPVNVEPLTNLKDEAKQLASDLRPWIDYSYLTSPEAKRRAGAAYLAICLDYAEELRQKRPQQWQQALEALEQFGQLRDALFSAPTPAGEVLKQKARAAGLIEKAESRKSKVETKPESQKAKDENQ